MMLGSVIHTTHAILLINSTSRPLQVSGLLGITQFPCTIQKNFNLSLNRFTKRTSFETDFAS